MMHSANLSLCVRAVIVVCPADFPYTIPFSSTVAIVVSELVHVIEVFVVFSGKIVAFNESSSYTKIDAEDSDNEIELAGIGVTVTSQDADRLFTVVAVIVAVPSELPIIVPDASTLTIDGCELDQERDLSSAFVGSIEGESVVSLSIFISSVSVREIEEGRRSITETTIVSDISGDCLLIHII